MKGITIAIAAQKGGVGKTTSTVNIAAYLARLGKRILIVDIDAQRNCTLVMVCLTRSLELGSTLIRFCHYSTGWTKCNWSTAHLVSRLLTLSDAIMVC